MTQGDGMAQSDGALAVELRGIDKHFPGVIANHDVDLRVKSGTIHAVVGENGAGKSTLMKTLYGMHQPDGGTITVNGVQQQFKSPSEAIAAGIGMVHQHFMLADNFTVLENIILGAEPANGQRIDFDKARDQVHKLAESVGTHLDLDVPVSELGVGKRQRVEILKVLFRGAKILILDEPTAVLVPQEVDELFLTLRHLVDDGATIIFISHKLKEVLAVSDEITVMRQGTTVATVLPKDTDRRRLAELMVGSELPSPEGRDSEIRSDVALQIEHLTVTAHGQRDLVHDANITVRNGEIVGIAGIEGNGQFELCSAILGLTPSSGTVVVTGHDVTRHSTRARREAGLAYIPFDRHREGLMLESPLWENAMLGREDMPQFRKGPFIDAKSAKADCEALIERFDVLTPSETVPAFALSGGNQQKLLVGRELSSEPRVLIAAHPTRGVDIGAQAAIWDEIRHARDAGLAVLLISADLDELIGLSDTILVMYDGAITATLDPAKVTPEILGTHMTGGTAEAA